MRKPPLVPTKRHRVVACVLVVGKEQALEDLCRSCAEFTGAQLVTSDVATVTTRAAQWRPLVIVVPSGIYEFDPEEFDALARAVNAEIVNVTPQRLADPLLKNELIKMFRDALLRRAPVPR